MERQEDLVKRQEEGEDVTLELEVAQLDYAEALQKAQEQSRSYHDAVRELERAEADLVDQEEKSEKSLQRMIELQHKKTEVINKTTSETVEYALAIQEAQDALDNFSPAGYERALKELEKITGDSSVFDMFGEITGYAPATGSGIAAGDTAPPVVNTVAALSTGTSNTQTNTATNTGGGEGVITTPIKTEVVIAENKIIDVVQNAIVKGRLRGNQGLSIE